ncbi:MAG: phosphoglucomutase/phosphomannomutase family protein [Erysipelotrichaceae bacterium]|nr:phosphoglucomutase/phosphomannomutase family protein [Erysipelotrichaceae bacterium]
MLKFGTGGWRAVIGDEFTKQNLQILAKAMADKMHAEGVSGEGIVIGHDRRFLANESVRWLAEVFAAEGIHTMIVNKACPTPVVMYYVQVHDMHYGLMVTASHNPAEYNGVKVFTYGGRDADLEQTADIERYISQVKLPVCSKEYEACIEEGIITEFSPVNEYIDSIIDDIDVQKIRNANLNIVLDPMYGVSETCIKTILITARCGVETIHGYHDPLFGGHMPAPDSDSMHDLRAYVISHRCDLGIATDGDADRIGIIDDNGRYLSPNDVIMLLDYYLVKHRGMHGPVVRNLCTSHMIDRMAKYLGQEVYEVPVGFKWISSKMDETNAVIGGESSGGLSVAGRIKGKDGVYAAALLVEMLAYEGKKMSVIYDELCDIVGRSYMAQHNYRFRAEHRDLFLKRIMEDREVPVFPYETDHVSYMDGCKVYFKNGGWVSIRFSGTEPLLRVFAEMETQEQAEEICEICRQFLGIS